VISEAEVFVLADRAAVQVYGQIREDQWETQLPPLFDMPGADQPIPLRQAINRYAYDNAWVPDMLAGRTIEEVGRDHLDGGSAGRQSTRQPRTAHRRRRWHFRGACPTACGMERSILRRCGDQSGSSVRPSQSQMTHHGVTGSSPSLGGSPDGRLHRIQRFAAPRTASSAADALEAR
jgi:hypothetical protein